MDRTGKIIATMPGASMLLAILLALITAPIGHVGGGERQLTHTGQPTLALPQFTESAVLTKRAFISADSAAKRDGSSGGGVLPVACYDFTYSSSGPQLHWSRSLADPNPPYVFHAFQARAPPFV